MTVIGWKDRFCGASLPGHAKPWFKDGHPDEIDPAEVEAFGKAVALHSRKISEGQTDIIPKLPSKEAFDEFYGYGIGGGQPEGGMTEPTGGGIGFSRGNGAFQEVSEGRRYRSKKS